MQFTRRGFIGGLVATATMAEAGVLAEILDFIRRKPVHFVPPRAGWPARELGPRLFVSRDGKDFVELPVIGVEFFDKIAKKIEQAQKAEEEFAAASRKTVEVFNDAMASYGKFSTDWLLDRPFDVSMAPGIIATA